MTSTPPAVPGSGPVLVLASASTARRATLRRAGVDPTVRVSGVDEDEIIRDAEEREGPVTPADAALLLARAKAESVVDTAQGDVIVLGCDSVLELDGHMYGKPVDGETARERWRRMRGRVAHLHTGHWLIDARSQQERTAVGETVSTRIWFADLDDATVDAYVATGEPLGVAGGFTVDGLGGAFVDRIEGDFHNVVGVSLPWVRAKVEDMGVAWTSLWAQDASS